MAKDMIKSYWRGNGRMIHVVAAGNVTNVARAIAERLRKDSGVRVVRVNGAEFTKVVSK